MTPEHDTGADGEGRTGRGPVPRPWFILRHLWWESGVLVLGAGFFVAVLAITLVVSRFTEIEQSGWALGANLPQWYMLGMGAYMTAVYLPLYIAHGLTRRRFMVEGTAFMVALSIAGAAVTTAGFVVERQVYRFADWPQEPGGDHDALFTSLDQYGLIFVGFGMVFLVFTVIGAFVAAAFYRQAWGGLMGFLMIPPALVSAATTELVLQRNAPIPVQAFADWELADAGSVGVCLVAFLVGLGLTWTFVRDLPLRPKAV